MSPVVNQSLIKDPKLSSIVMNPHVKRQVKNKTFTDALTKSGLSPIIFNFISESPTRAEYGPCSTTLTLVIFRPHRPLNTVFYVEKY